MRRKDLRRKHRKSTDGLLDNTGMVPRCTILRDYQQKVAARSDGNSLTLQLVDKGQGLEVSPTVHSTELPSSCHGFFERSSFISPGGGIHESELDGKVRGGLSPGGVENLWEAMCAAEQEEINRAKVSNLVSGNMILQPGGFVPSKGACNALAVQTRLSVWGQGFVREYELTPQVTVWGGQWAGSLFQDENIDSSAKKQGWVQTSSSSEIRGAAADDAVDDNWIPKDLQKYPYTVTKNTLCLEDVTCLSEDTYGAGLSSMSSSVAYSADIQCSTGPCPWVHEDVKACKPDINSTFTQGGSYKASGEEVYHVMEPSQALATSECRAGLLNGLQVSEMVDQSLGMRSEVACNVLPDVQFGLLPKAFTGCSPGLPSRQSLDPSLMRFVQDALHNESFMGCSQEALSTSQLDDVHLPLDGTIKLKMDHLKHVDTLSLAVSADLDFVTSAEGTTRPVLPEVPVPNGSSAFKPTLELAALFSTSMVGEPQPGGEATQLSLDVIDFPSQPLDTAHYIRTVKTQLHPEVGSYACIVPHVHVNGQRLNAISYDQQGAAFGERKLRELCCQMRTLWKLGYIALAHR